MPEVTIYHPFQQEAVSTALDDWRSGARSFPTILHWLYGVAYTQGYTTGIQEDTPMPRDYGTMTTEDFDRILLAMVAEMSAAQILAYGDVYTTLAEELNNDVLSAWDAERDEQEPED